MEWKKSSKFWVILASSLLGLVVLLVLYRLIRKNSEANEDSQLIQDNQDDPTELSIAEHYIMIKNLCEDKGYNLTTAQLLTAQAMHESGQFSSELYHENNNMFGMRQPQQRQTTSQGEVGGYASYATPEDSVKDMFLWLDAKGDFDESVIIDPSTYCSWLKSKSYFEDSLINYKSGVTRNLKQLQTELAAG